MTRPVSLFPKKRYIIRIAALAIASLIYLGYGCLPSAKHPGAEEKYYYVLDVIDGDTLKLADGRKVRMIGVDTPELHFSRKLAIDAKRTGRDIDHIRAMGKKASDFTKTLCRGKKVRLEHDVDKLDRYGRTLAYVYLEDGTFVNARILEEGLGSVMTVPPNVRNADYFLKLQQKARGAGKGFWGK